MFLFDWRTYLLNPREIFTFSTLQAAGVYQGGLIIAILFAIVYMRRTGLPALLTCDVFAPGLAIGPCNRPARLSGCRLLLGICLPSTVGDHVHQTRSPRTYRCAIGRPSASCATVRIARRVPDFWSSLSSSSTGHIEKDKSLADTLCFTPRFGLSWSFSAITSRNSLRDCLSRSGSRSQHLGQAYGCSRREAATSFGLRPLSDK